jgi:hypothetical protein
MIPQRVAARHAHPEAAARCGGSALESGKDLEGENEHLREQLAAADSIRYPEGAADVCFCLFCLAVDDVVDAMLSYDAPNAVKIANGILAIHAPFPPRDAVTSAL